MTKKEYGQDLAFTAEVDVRPEIALPDLQALTVSVDSIEVTDDDVDIRTAVVACPVRHPDRGGPAGSHSGLVTIDLSATVDGEDVPGAARRGNVP